MSKQALEDKIQELKDEIKDLKRNEKLRDKEFQNKEKEIELRFEEGKLLGKETFLNEMKEVQVSLASYKAQVKELENRIKESPYTQLSEILKALTVKLPTFDIKGLTVTTKK